MRETFTGREELFSTKNQEKVLVGLQKSETDRWPAPDPYLTWFVKQKSVQIEAECLKKYRNHSPFNFSWKNLLSPTKEVVSQDDV